MALVRWRPRTNLWDPFAEIQAEMNRLFDNTLQRVGGGLEGVAFSPPIDVVEEKDRFLVTVDLPGLKKEDVSVLIQEHYLTIRGEKKRELESKDANYYRSERLYGSFSRTIELPGTVDASKISASFKDGVLHVTLPKTEEAKPKEIKVNAN